MSEPASDKINTKSDQTINKKLTTDSETMEKIDLVYLKLAINEVPVLTQDNFSICHTRILNYFDILRIKDYFLEGKGTISKDNAWNVRTILTAKIDAAVHANVITHINKDDALLIWKAIIKFFASQHAANQA
ncbi:hypothetical protein VP01_8329g1 [Puccinia sorghi]|uniref:Uncharacterized protein n=1 Tax=Puccinia sorghi TaxID=27349 RepID=A0A0L6UAH0_9BASI|nr:hypothetical protein VP01_8329g1 [Puccinia sorghi]